MGRGPSTFRQQDVTRALKAAKAAGMEIVRVEIGKDGKIILTTGKPAEPTTTDAPRPKHNPWDSIK